MVYENASNTNLKQLEPIMNGGLRLITGAFRTTKALNMHCELGMLPLEYKREIAIGKKAIQILGNKNHPPYKKLTNTEIDSKVQKHPRIRPPFFYRARKILELNNISQKFQPITTTTCDPWTITNIKTDLSLSFINKDNTIVKHNNQITLQKNV